jgi:hypothetical protein
MRYIPRALLAGGLGFAVAVVVAACGGSSGLLSPQQASTLTSRLDAVASAIQSNHCTQAGAAAQKFDNAVSNLPGSVNATLTDNLKQASAALAAQAQPDCESSQRARIPTTTKAPPPPATTSRPAPSPTTGTGATTSSTSTGSHTSSTPATTGTAPGTTSTSGGSGGAGLGHTSTSSGSGGSSPGNGNAQ